MTPTPWYKNPKTIAAYAGLIAALCSGYVSIHNSRTKSTETKVDSVYAHLLSANLLLSQEVEKTQQQLYELRQYVDKRDEEIAIRLSTPSAAAPIVDRPKPLVRRAKPKTTTPAPQASAAPTPILSSAPPPAPPPELILPDKVTE